MLLDSYKFAEEICLQPLINAMDAIPDTKYAELLTGRKAADLLRVFADMPIDMRPRLAELANKYIDQRFDEEDGVATCIFWKCAKDASAGI